MSSRWTLPLLLSLATPAWAEGTPSAPALDLKLPSLQNRVDVGSLPSGLQIALHEDSDNGLVALTAMVDLGWRAEGTGQAGWADVFERAWWRSEVAPNVRLGDHLVTDLGCEIDGLVGPDALELQAACPKDQTAAAVRAFAHLWADPLAGVTDAAVRDAADAVVRDRAARVRFADQQAPLLARAFAAAVFPEGHPYRTSVTPATPPSAAELRAWASKRILPPTSTLTLVGGWPDESGYVGPGQIVGNLPLPMVDARLKPADVSCRAFLSWEEIDTSDPSSRWCWPPQSADKTKALELGTRRPGLAKLKEAQDPPAPPESGPLSLSAALDAPTVFAVWSLPGGWREGDALHEVVARTVHGVVAKHLTNEPALDRLLGCFVVAGVDASLLACGAQLKPEAATSAARVGDRILDQLSYVLDQENDIEVDAARALAQRATLVEGVRQADELGGLRGSRAASLSTGLHLAGDALFASNRLRNVTTYDLKGVRDFVKRWLTRDRARLVIADAATPERDRVPAVGRREAKDRDARLGQPTLLTALAVAATPSSVPDAHVTPQRRAADAPKLPDDALRSFTLDNGLDVVVIGTASATAQVRLVGAVGTANDPTPDLRYSWARSFILPTRKSADTLAANWFGWTESRGPVFGIKGSAANVPELAYLLRDALDGMRVTFKNKIPWATEWRDAAWADASDVASHLDAARRAHLFGNHATGRQPTWTTYQGWASLDGAVAEDVMRSQWAPERTTLVVQTDRYSMDEAEQAARDWFASWKVAAPADATLIPGTATRAPMPTGTSLAVWPLTGGPGEVVASCRVDGSLETAEAIAAWWRTHLPTGMTAALIEPEAWTGGTATVTLRATAPADDAGRVSAALLDAMRALGEGRANAGEVARALALAAAPTHHALSAGRRAAGWVTEQIGLGRTPTDALAAVSARAGWSERELTAPATACATTAYIGWIGDASALTDSLRAAGLSPTTMDAASMIRAAQLAVDPKAVEKADKKAAR
jgi:hypothetical protein